MSNCWNIGIDRGEDCKLVEGYKVEGGTFSLYTTRLRDPPGVKDGRLSPELALGDSVMSGRLLISGRHLWSLMSGRLRISGRNHILTRTMGCGPVEKSGGTGKRAAANLRRGLTSSNLNTSASFSKARQPKPPQHYRSLIRPPSTSAPGNSSGLPQLTA